MSLPKHTDALAYWHLNDAANTDATMGDHTCSKHAHPALGYCSIYKLSATAPTAECQNGEIDGVYDAVADSLSG